MKSQSHPSYSWTQPICLGCYAERCPGREPLRMIDPPEERCCDCAMTTNMGVYLRVDPSTVAHPTLRKEE